MPTGLKEPKTSRPCPKPNYANPQQPTEEEKKEYEGQVREWVLENAEVDSAGGCFNWKGAYSALAGGARYNNFAAHSFIYRLLVAPDYIGNLLRTCKNRRCVNPDHCRPAVGERTKRKQETKRIVEQGEVVLKEDGRREVVAGIKGQVMEEMERVVKSEMKKLEKDVVEGVVAKLIEVKFDEMVGQEVVKQMRGGK